jgi:hypothetical protein
MKLKLDIAITYLLTTMEKNPKEKNYKLTSFFTPCCKHP